MRLNKYKIKCRMVSWTLGLCDTFQRWFLTENYVSQCPRTLKFIINIFKCFMGPCDSFLTYFLSLRLIFSKCRMAPWTLGHSTYEMICRMGPWTLGLWNVNITDRYVNRGVLRTRNAQRDWPITLPISDRRCSSVHSVIYATSPVTSFYKNARIFVDTERKNWK